MHAEHSGGTTHGSAIGWILDSKPNEPDLDCPHFICCACGERITHADAGIVEWVDHDWIGDAYRRRPPNQHSWRIRHKSGVCSAAYRLDRGEQAAGIDRYAWEDLDDFLGYLVTNFFRGHPQKDQICSALWAGIRNETPARSRSARKTKGHASRTRSVTPSQRYRILRRDNFTCQLCGRTAAEHGVVLRVDHQQPHSKGGACSDENLWTLCEECNQGKGASL